MIPIGITARNEARNILALIESLKASIARAESETGCRYQLHLLLNDNTDETPQLAASIPGLTVWHTTGGLVEAQRAFAEAFAGRAPFVIFSDADILAGSGTVAAVTRAMLGDSRLVIAYAEKYPVEPLRRGLLARALYLYNLREGYQTRRHYLNGQFFAIRHWNIPKVEDLNWDPALDNGFLNLKAGIRCDDIYLSRVALARSGPESILCVPEGIRYRPPETLTGMFRKYQRMVLEIERLHCYFPETRPAHEQWGRRRLDRSLLAAAPLREKFYYAVFQAGLLLCKAAYAAQRIYYSRFSSAPCPTWRPVAETKEPVR
ncbi:MAG: glycosyltransferase [Acidobacteria bacterium]|nr:glycosyltransferase [Acidobacteriota bacterium]